MALRTLLGIVAVLALLTGALYFWHFKNIYYPDSPSYIAPAENLLAGRGFTAAPFEISGVSVDAQGMPESLRTPGYPLFLAPFLWLHANLRWAVLFQHIVRVLIILGASGFAFRISHNRRVTLVSGVLLSIDFPLLEAANAILTELLFTAVLMIVYWFLWQEAQDQERPGLRVLSAGLLAGASVLIRPVSILFFLPAVIFLAIARPRLKVQAALIFVVGFACLPAAWAMRNHSAIGRFTVSTISGFSLLQYRAAGTLAIERPGDFHTNFETAQKELEDRACLEMQRVYSRDCSDITPAEKAEYYSHFARKVVLQHPFGFLRSSGRGAAIMMLDGGATTLTGLVGTSWPTGMRILMLYTAPVLLLAIYGLAKSWRINRAFFWLAVLVIGYFVVVSAGPESYGRFRVPFLPLYAILAAFGTGHRFWMNR